jgi:type II secretory pathway component PulC
LKSPVFASRWFKRKRVTRILSILSMTILYAWVISGIVNSVTDAVLYDFPVPVKTLDPTRINRNRAPGSMDAYAVIAQRNLMHVAGTGPDRSNQFPVEAMDSLAGMGLVLKGTITGPEGIARAIVEESGIQRLYRIGDSLAGGTLTSVFRDWIILTVGGRRAMLALRFDNQDQHIHGSSDTIQRLRALAGPVTEQEEREIQRTDHAMEQIREAQELRISKTMNGLPPEERAQAIERVSYTLDKIREAQELNRLAQKRRAPRGPMPWDKL